MANINERIQSIVNELFDGNLSKFERACGLKKNTLSHVVSGRFTKPSFDTIELILSNLDISPNWLILGEGEMYKQNFSAGRDNNGSGNIVKGDNSGVVGNTGTVGNVGCHSINVDPEQKIKKIIDGGKVEVELDQPTELILRENESLKVRIKDLEALLNEKDRTIGYLEQIAFGNK